MDPILIIAAAFSIIILAFAFIIIYIITQKKLLKQQALHNRELLEASMRVQEEERKRFAEDLHDDIGAKLSLLKLKIDTQEVFNNVTLPADIKNLINDSIHSTRSVSKALSPVLLEKYGLIKALKNLVENINTLTVAVSFTNEGLEKRLNNATEIGIYRITQEMITNIIKHGKGTYIELFLNITQGAIEFEIKDNGMAFNIAEVSKYSLSETGLGLKNIESRIKMLKANIEYNRIDNINATRFIFPV